MKHGIFISYSSFDTKKVKLIVAVLKENAIFYPIVIASNSEALKPLAQKVTEGIIKAEIILPIMTERSIQTQWINQEIGYSTALGKRIMPIIERNLIDNLKGFIHKQIDLPYTYEPNEKQATENKAFVKEVRRLIADLEKQYPIAQVVKVVPEKSDLEKSLDKFDEIRKEKETQRRITTFLESKEAVDVANTEVLSMFADIKAKTNKLTDKKLHVAIEEGDYPLTLIVKCNGFSFSIKWHQSYIDSIQDATLYVNMWIGYFTQKQTGMYFTGDEPKLQSSGIYTFDMTKNNENTWLAKGDKKHYNSASIADTCLNWLVTQVMK